MSEKKINISKEAKKETKEIKKEKGYFYNDKQVNSVLSILSEAPGKFAIPIHDIIRNGKEIEA